MTSPSERSVAFSRGKAMAAAASASREAALRHNGLAFIHEDDVTVIVENAYRMNLAASHWHRIDDPSVHGYLVTTLLADIRDRTNSEKPAVGRDSAASEKSTLVRPDAVAESTAGALTTEMLMELPAWP